MHLLLLVVCLLLSSSVLAQSPLEISKNFQADLNRFISQRDVYRIRESIDNHFYYTPCNGHTVDKYTYAVNLNLDHRQGTVISARDDGNYIYYQVNYGYKWSLVYLITSKVYGTQKRELIFAKQIDCNAVDTRF